MMITASWMAFDSLHHHHHLTSRLSRLYTPKKKTRRKTQSRLLTPVAGSSLIDAHEDETSRSLANQKLPSKLAAVLSDPAEGDAAVSLQLAGVSVIGGAVWEVGRLAAKEKAPTRVEYERDVLLYQEFDEFASKRLIVGEDSCHRSDVISAFRRYNPKYRRADSEEYPLADIEIERILRQWNRQFGSRSEMSSAGFFSGITVDGAADVFAPR